VLLRVDRCDAVRPARGLADPPRPARPPARPAVRPLRPRGGPCRGAALLRGDVGGRARLVPEAQARAGERGAVAADRPAPVRARADRHRARGVPVDLPRGLRTVVRDPMVALFHARVALGVQPGRLQGRPEEGSMVTEPEHARTPSPTEICRLLLDAGAVRFGEFTLASGEKSDVYIDVKRA